MALSSRTIKASTNSIWKSNSSFRNRLRLLVFSLHHHDEEDSAFVPAPEPAYSPIINVIAKRNRLAKPKELCLNVHGSLPHTSMARLGRTVNFAFRESQSQSAIESQIASDNGTQRAPLDYSQGNPLARSRSTRQRLLVKLVPRHRSMHHKSMKRSTLAVWKGSPENWRARGISLRKNRLPET